MVPEILVNTHSDNGLLPEGTKPLTEPVLTINEILWHSFQDNVYLNYIQDINPQAAFENYKFKITATCPKGHLLNTPCLRQNGWDFADDIFKCIFLRKSMNF